MLAFGLNKYSQIHRRFFCISLLIIGFSFCAMGQAELPPISNFTYQDHKGGTQNWMIDQSDDRYIYIANNEGLLEYNGDRWRRYPSANQTLLRSVKTHGDRVYTGCYMDLGYWLKDNTGRLYYQSLIDRMTVPMLEGEQIWNIHQSEDWIVFQSLDRIYLYDSRSEKVDLLEFEYKVVKTFKVGNDIYFQSTGHGLYLIKEGKPQLIANDSFARDKLFVALYIHNSELMAITNEGVLLKKSSGTFLREQMPALAKGTAIYSAVVLHSGKIALGTISDGVVLVNPNGTLHASFDKSQGLQNNTVLSIFEDIDHNIWAGLNDGIDALHLESSIRISGFDDTGIGAVYASSILGDRLYLGTNQGLYAKKNDGTFDIIEGTEEQVWSLATVGDQLLCGHNKGLFVVEDEKIISRLSEPQGIWGMRRFPGDDNLLLVGAYEGLYVLRKTSTSWRLDHKIEGFDISAKFFEWAGKQHVIVSHEYKGVYHIKLSEDYTRAVEVVLDTTVNKGRHAGLVKHGEDIFFSKEGGIWKYDMENERFQGQRSLSSLQSPEIFISGKLIAQGERLWVFSKNHLYSISRDRFNGDEKVETVPVAQKFRFTKRGYENIYHLGNQRYLLGTTEGYTTIDLTKSMADRSWSPMIEEVIVRSSQSLIPRSVDLHENGSFDHTDNSLTIHLTSTSYDPLYEGRYEYKLNDNPWATSDLPGMIVLDQLTPDEYILSIRSMSQPNDVIQYSFEIMRPWYRQSWAICLLLLMSVLLIYLINLAYTKYYQNQQDLLIQKNRRQLEVLDLEAQQAISKLENERLQADIENKNRELGISTMHTIKQNELLNSLKSTLQDVNDVKQIPKVIEIIDQNLDTESDWHLFEKAFNEADSDFFKKVKKNHPELTPSDLKLCAYLRLNLSSKEMAPLLNISHRSVEIKRYRLRKKLQLSHEKDLVEYILEV